MNTNERLPLVSVIIPCLNEKHFIVQCLDSIVSIDYPKERLEVLIVDGMSEDGTRDIIADYEVRYPFFHLLDNPKKMQNPALNIGIQSAKGEVIMRMDAHSTYKENYIAECVRALFEYGADNVGGRWVTVPRDDTILGKAICFVMSIPFGVGNAYYRLRRLDRDMPLLDKPKWDIHVAYFCCRREVFDKIGLIYEKLDYSGDIDFRRRLQAAGLRTLFVPTVECHYFMRTNFWSFVKHMFHNGYWVLRPLSVVPGVSFSVRHIIPMMFLLSVVGSGILGFIFPVAWILFAAAVLLYGFLSLYYSFRIALRERDMRYFFLLPFIFLSLHVFYGLGSLVAFIQLLPLRLAKSGKI